MRKIDITELMDNYTDNEFNIGGETGVEAEKVVSAVLPQVRAKKKVKPIFKVLIAAAAAAFVLAGAVVGSDFLSGSFTSGSGIKFKYEIDEDGKGGGYEARLDYEGTLTTEDDRLYLNTGGETIDITDLTDEETPYIYSYTNPGTGDDAYLIAIGTPTHYEFVDLFHVERWGWIGFGCINGNGMDYIEVSTVEFPESKEFKPAEDCPIFFSDKYAHISYDGFSDYSFYRGENGDYMCINERNETTMMLSEAENVPGSWIVLALDQLDLLP